MVSDLVSDVSQSGLTHDPFFDLGFGLFSSEHLMVKCLGGGFMVVIWWCVVVVVMRGESECSMVGMFVL